MIFDVISFFNDHAINYATEGHKHCQDGWAQVPCPFCTGNPGWHLGYDLRAGYFNCWRCGFKSNVAAVRGLLVCDWSKAYEIVKKYQSSLPFKLSKKQKRKTRFKLPVGCKEPNPRHIKYLRGRGYKPYLEIEKWGLLGTGPTGKYKHRIIAPIQYNGQIVSYQGRDITDKHKLKYKACREEEEIIHHKKILYGLDQAKSDTCVLVEGVFDVWRLGSGAVCGFGINLKESQIELLYERFKRIFILFDDDPEAKNQAERIGHKLIHLDCEVTLNFIKGDPGEMSYKKARRIMRNIFK